MASRAAQQSNCRCSHCFKHWPPDVASFTNIADGIAATVILPAAGVRHNSNGSRQMFGQAGYFWTSTWAQTYPFGTAWSTDFRSTSVRAGADAHWQAFGFSIRCVQ